MVEMELASAVAQFGVAGLICWMWLAERRASAERDRQVRESHERLMQERVLLREVVKVVKSNTRALAALEAAHRHLVVSLARQDRGERRGDSAA